MEGFEKFPHATNYWENNRHLQTLNHISHQQQNPSQQQPTHQQQPRHINDQMDLEQPYNGNLQHQNVLTLPQNLPTTSPNGPSLSPNTLISPNPSSTSTNMIADKSNGVDLKADKAVQVDWSFFADEDNRHIMEKFAMNTSKMVEEDEDEHQREIRNYRSREYNLLGHLNDYRKRTDDLKRKLHLKEMHVGRVEGELMKYKECLVEARGKERELQYLINDLQLSIKDVMEKYREERVLSSLRDAEQTSNFNKLKSQVKDKPSKGPSNGNEIIYSADKLALPAGSSLRTSLSMTNIPPSITITDQSITEHTPSKNHSKNSRGSFDKTDSLSSEDSYKSGKKKKNYGKKEMDSMKQSNTISPVKSSNFSEKYRREILLNTLLHEF